MLNFLGHLIKKEIKVNSKYSIKTSRAHRDFSSALGVLQLFVLISIVYSTYVVFLGTDGIAPKVMLVPQALYVGYLAFHKFTK